MKESNKVLLYGLVASILLILLCLYAHQDEFINKKNNVTLESEKKNERLYDLESVQKEIEYNGIPLQAEFKAKEPEKKAVPTNRATVEETIEENENKTFTKNSTEVEENASHKTVIRTIFKNKEEIKLREHPKVKHVEKIKEVDKNLPIHDNKPLVDNEKSKKKEEKKKKVLTPPSKTASKSIKKEKHKSIASIQKSISKVTSRHISFYKNKAEITNKSKATLNKVIKLLKTVPNAKIVVKGYTDASGKAKTNLWISQKRANSVRHYLGKHGIPLKNIVAKGFGESELLYGDKPYSALNRRVEIEIKRK